MTKYFATVALILTVQFCVAQKVKNATVDDCRQEPWRQALTHKTKSWKKKSKDLSLQLINDSIIDLPGKKVILNKDGFPKQVQSYFSKEMNAYSTSPVNLLFESIHFHFTKKSNGKNVDLRSKGVQFIQRSEKGLVWTCRSISDSLQMDVTGSAKPDGTMQFIVAVTALADIDFKDVVLHIPYQKNVTTYMQGLGVKGGARPELVEWNWKMQNDHAACAWVGNVNAGLQFSLESGQQTHSTKSEDSGITDNWINDNQGGITVGVKGSSMLANIYSGPVGMKKDDIYYYNFDLLVTPLHLCTEW